MEDKSLYLEAAKIVAKCSKDRLPLVLNLISKSGVELAEEDVKKLRGQSSKSDALKYKRKATEHVAWKESDDPSVIRMRKAYDNGVSFTSLERESGISRAMLYLYLRGERKIPQYKREKLDNALSVAESAKLF